MADPRSFHFSFNCLFTNCLSPTFLCWTHVTYKSEKTLSEFHFKVLFKVPFPNQHRRSVSSTGWSGGHGAHLSLFGCVPSTKWKSCCGGYEVPCGSLLWGAPQASWRPPKMSSPFHMVAPLTRSGWCWGLDAERN